MASRAEHNARAVVALMCKALAMMILAVGIFARPASAQLLSPGKLSSPHAALEGMNNCTSCHELGKPGASDAKCLACHTLLKARIDRKSGFHSALVDRPCASCHKEHFGVNFAVLKFDTAGFDHRKTGYELKLGHLKASCRACHGAARVADAAVRTYATEHKTLDHTFLGLAQTCISCHRADDVHAGQFANRSCADCHTEKTWKEAPSFNHDQTRYALTGQHRNVRCSDCHRAPATAMAGARRELRFANLAYSTCTDCHRDPHKGVMRQSCENCHTTDGWSRLNRSKFEASFDHSRTKFALKGAHTRAACEKCHTTAARNLSWTVRVTLTSDPGRNAYPIPKAADCQSCHIDAHQNAFVKTAGGPACQNCHTDASWLPTTYDLARHSRETYALTGAHQAVPCGDCHKKGTPDARVPQFHIEAKECSSCHARSDPHQGQFAGRACSECHKTDAFRMVAFDHSKTRYPLDGAHQKVPCASCHQKANGPQGAYVRYKPLETSCRACHGAAIPRKS